MEWSAWYLQTQLCSNDASGVVAAIAAKDQLQHRSGSFKPGAIVTTKLGLVALKGVCANALDRSFFPEVD